MLPDLKITTLYINAINCCYGVVSSYFVTVVYTTTFMIIFMGIDLDNRTILLALPL